MGCADYDMAKGELSDTGWNAPRETGDADDSDTGAPTAPAWYVVRAALAVIDGLPSAAGASITVDIVDEDLDRVDCSVDLDAALVVAGPAADSSEPLWWEVPVSPATAPCAPIPDTLALGVGALEPDIRARLGTVGVDDVADSLYGAYLRADAGETSTYGYAGTETDRQGDDVATLPPPDGVYQLAPLYLLPLPG
jgi:hypothetical protein